MAPEHRGRGVARALNVLVARELLERGCRRVLGSVALEGQLFLRRALR